MNPAMEVMFVVTKIVNTRFIYNMARLNFQMPLIFVMVLVQHSEGGVDLA